jgi:hypothetical protein
MHLTIFKHKLNTANGSFLVWTSDKSMRKPWFHGFTGATSPRYHFAFHFLGFVGAGSFKVAR